MFASYTYCSSDQPRETDLDTSSKQVISSTRVVALCVKKFAKNLQLSIITSKEKDSSKKKKSEET